MKRLSLVAARVDAGLTQEAVGKALNVAKKTVSNWEKGKTAPSSIQVAKLCELYGRPYEEINWV